MRAPGLDGYSFGDISHPRLSGSPLLPTAKSSSPHASTLASIGELAGGHHERLDGAGYHRKTQTRGLGRAVRILAAADAEAELLREADEGRLCPQAVDAVLAAGKTTKEIAETRASSPHARLVEDVLDVVAGRLG